jgi:uncharacterized NAD(P)/FAD-binding protein YdhS
VVRLDNGAVVNADAVVLATGDYPPSTASRFAANTVDASLLPPFWGQAECLRVKPDARIFILGCGLTAVDAILYLRSNGHHGPITALSRHGLTPSAHASVNSISPPAQAISRDLRSARLVLRAFRTDVKRRSGDWRAAIDALRAQTNDLWSRLPAAEKKRFLRHVRPHWDRARHRMAPEIARQIETFQTNVQANGGLRIQAGRLVSLAQDGDALRVSFLPRGSSVLKSELFDHALDCSGSARDLTAVADPLLCELLASPWAQLDETRLGLAVDPTGALLAKDGRPSTQLFALGPLRRGTLWESTAVPELREQAQELATVLLRMLGAERKIAAVP